MPTNSRYPTGVRPLLIDEAARRRRIETRVMSRLETAAYAEVVLPIIDFVPLKEADGVFIAQVARLEQIPEDQRLKPERVVASLAKAGRPAFYEQNAEAIVNRIVPMLRPKDVVVVFSNGGFDNIHEKLLMRLKS